MAPDSTQPIQAPVQNNSQPTQQKKPFTGKFKNPQAPISEKQLKWLEGIVDRQNIPAKVLADYLDLGGYATINEIKMEDFNAFKDWAQNWKQEDGYEEETI